MLQQLTSAKTKEGTELQDHVTGTYDSLRLGLVILGIGYPFLLLGLGYLWYGIPWMPTMSDYYWAKADDGGGLFRAFFANITFPPIKSLFGFLGTLDGEAPMRSWFTGPLFVLGVFLWLYKGVSDLENNLLNAAGIGALGIALFPMMKPGCTEDCNNYILHFVFVLIAFGSIAIVALFCARQTLKQFPLSEAKNTYYNTRYTICGVVMIGAPLIAGGLRMFLPRDTPYAWYVNLGYIIEAISIWAFAIYWAIKSKELKERVAKKPALEDPQKEANAATSSTGTVESAAPAQ